MTGPVLRQVVLDALDARALAELSRLHGLTDRSGDAGHPFCIVG